MLIEHVDKDTIFLFFIGFLEAIFISLYLLLQWEECTLFIRGCVRDSDVAPLREGRVV